MNLPTRIFFTGVPGSRWSSVAQAIEQLPGFNTSDRTPAREYKHSKYSGHVGAYFGRGMEFDACLDAKAIDRAWTEPAGTKVVKSHDWAYKLETIHQTFEHDWIMLVYRPDMASYAWWHEAGGFNIQYPNYRAYKDSSNMLSEIMAQNKCILEFAAAHGAVWHHFGTDWLFYEFGHHIQLPKYSDVLVTIVRNK